MRGMAPSYRARPGPASRAGSPAIFRRNIPPALSAMAGLFRPEGDHETKRRGYETISRAGEDVRKLAMVTNPANE
ncbi:MULTISPECIES: hypothetical protein [unclassified Bradyrhizobium]|uniref:hypothetical protein n=1 Tax=unclassified Bradyrhizobium TaxID=2631580 RepID=UPI0015CDA46F|nr:MULTISPECIES: hypothetical protein [unclassified Bradyrhizobium]MBB4259578.1 hypothetical protein [Bradyrhizobium sp. CIR3A]NYG47781.1 hypothetical protein [Bradyrhizobium sp. IAR9]